MIKGEIDFSPLTNRLHEYEALGEAVNGRRFRDQVVTGFLVMGREVFGRFADKRSEENRSALHHVYEWGAIGTPPGRLFRLVSQGRGKSAALTYTWKASQKPVPRPKDDLRKSVNVFRWKAPMLESGQVVDVTGQGGAGGGWGAQSVGSGNVMAFMVKGEIQFASGSHLIALGKGTRGEFSALWNEFWSGLAATQVGRPWAARVDGAITKSTKRIAAKVQRPGKSATAANKIGLRINTGPRYPSRAESDKIITQLQADLKSGINNIPKEFGTSGIDY
jgi:hypothetical protein